MTAPPPDGSRDRRIEDLTNLHVIHPAAQALVPHALALGVSANAVSVAGMAVGVAAAAVDYQWRLPWAAPVGLGLAGLWLVLDGLDGMVARATGTASRLGRMLDGACDHGVFILIYCALAGSIGTAGAWTAAVVAGALHILQSMLFEGERARFHRRVRGIPAPQTAARVALYDDVAGSLDRLAGRFEQALARGGAALAGHYADAVRAPMRAMTLLSANTRVLAIFIACVVGRPMLFWAFEIGPLSLVALVTMAWHRRIEARIVEFWEDRQGAGSHANGKSIGHG